MTAKSYVSLTSVNCQLFDRVGFKLVFQRTSLDLIGLPERIRTSDLQIRKQ